jgi:hypothetical protein
MFYVKYSVCAQRHCRQNLEQNAFDIKEIERDIL